MLAPGLVTVTSFAAVSSVCLTRAQISLDMRSQTRAGTMVLANLSRFNDIGTFQEPIVVEDDFWAALLPRPVLVV